MTPDEERNAVLIALADQVVAEFRAWSRRLRDMNALLAEFDPDVDLEDLDW